VVGVAGFLGVVLQGHVVVGVRRLGACLRLSGGVLVRPLGDTLGHRLWRQHGEEQAVGRLRRHETVQRSLDV
jgi:hypothetical protein